LTTTIASAGAAAIAYSNTAPKIALTLGLIKFTSLLSNILFYLSIFIMIIYDDKIIINFSTM